MAEINLVEIEKYFGNNYVIRKLNLDINDGEFLVLLGPSGCGKTTTLRAIAGLEEIDSGDILIDGQPVQNLKASDRNIAFVFQLYALYPHLNAFDNIAFPLKATKRDKQTIDQRVSEVTKVLGIESILNKKPSELSSGDMQRVAVGRAMVRRPKAILMDEPIGSLDAKLRENMRTELKRLHIEINATTLYVTHDQVEAMSMADKVAIMEDGVLQQVGTPADVYDNPANLFVAQFVGSPIMNILDCRIDADDNCTQCFLGEDTPALPLAKSLYQNIESKGVPLGQLALGVRPEAVRLAREERDEYVKAQVHVIEPLGPFDILDLKVDSQIIRAKASSRFIEKPGESVWFQLDEQRTHFFDKDTGKSLGIKPEV
ncbi:MAG: ABC transporter ATP-binding protein [bacterium]|nr:ABC transporter ATP-binding protein [bacterium]